MKGRIPVKDEKKRPIPEFKPEIRRYYELSLEEDRLFHNADGELERVRTQEIISRYLPKLPAVVLDVGGGPGTYALWLAELGYQVHLVDPVQLHLDQAQAAAAQGRPPLHAYTLGDARSLDYPDNFADTILLLGPLYHLTRERDRLKALREAHRCLKPGGWLIAVGISRFASALAGLVEGHFRDPAFVKIARQDLADGQHRNPTGKASYFTTAFFHHPDQLGAEVEIAGFSLEALLAVEGVALLLQDLQAQWDDPIRRELILQAARWLEAEPTVIGATGHILAAGRKTSKPVQG